MAIAPVVYSKRGRLDLFLEPDLHEFGMFDVNKADQIYEAGYKAAMKHKDQLSGLLQQNS
jgi:NTE family protein